MGFLTCHKTVLLRLNNEFLAFTGQQTHLIFNHYVEFSLKKILSFHFACVPFHLLNIDVAEDSSICIYEIGI